MYVEITAKTYDGLLSVFGENVLSNEEVEYFQETEFGCFIIIISLICCLRQSFTNSFARGK